MMYCHHYLKRYRFLINVFWYNLFKKFLFSTPHDIFFSLDNVMNNDEINIKNFYRKEEKTTFEKETSQFSLKTYILC